MKWIIYRPSRWCKRKIQGVDDGWLKQNHLIWPPFNRRVVADWRQLESVWGAWFLFCNQGKDYWSNYLLVYFCKLVWKMLKMSACNFDHHTVPLRYKTVLLELISGLQSLEFFFDLEWYRYWSQNRVDLKRIYFSSNIIYSAVFVFFHLVFS